MMTNEKLAKRIRKSSLLVLIGLVAELGSLMWHHPTAFVVFLLIGGSLMAAGMVLFVGTLLTRGERT